ncbi:hypothetical protein RFI_23644, partial [Reticulomyxa filosa]
MNNEWDKSLDFSFQLAAKLLNEFSSHFDVSEQLLLRPVPLNTSEKAWVLSFKQKLAMNDKLAFDKFPNDRLLVDIQNKVFHIIFQFQYFEIVLKWLPMFVELDMVQALEVLNTNNNFFGPAAV